MSTRARNEHEMSTQSWYGIPIVGFQTLEPYTVYKLECLVTLTLYKKGKNKTEKIILHVFLEKIIKKKFVIKNKFG